MSGLREDLIRRVRDMVMGSVVTACAVGDIDDADAMQRALDAFVDAARSDDAPLCDDRQMELDLAGSK